MTQDTYNLASIWVYSISALIAFIMLGVAIFQLSRLTQQVNEAVKSNRINELGTFLDLENQIVNKRTECAKAAHYVQSLNGNPSVEELTNAQIYFNQCTEAYLNSLDRFCFCIIQKHFDNDSMKIEYRVIINNAVEHNPEFFTQATKFRNITKIHNLWSDT